MDPSSMRTKVPSFLSDLGRATLRGIRKCPRCGTYNGTRGLSCKNKSCGTIFRPASRKNQHQHQEDRPQPPPPTLDAVRILTGSPLRVFSVRQRERGPEQRCFVELGGSEPGVQTGQGTFLTQLGSPRCHLPACLKATAQGVAEKQCQHVKLALDCQVEATPLALKSSVLNAMQVPLETKQSLWQLATEPPGPLVQRVTKNVLVVKCKASQKHSLGYLHASFGQRLGGGDGTSSQQCCSCSCPTGKGGEEEEEEEEGAAPHCIHLLACLCALASDEGLAREFAHVLAQAAGGCAQLLDESQVSLSFQDWLASVTERIHQTMHYQFEGKPEPLVFHIPQAFFEALQQRISSGSVKKRLPNTTAAFVRRDALPLGTFSKYSWHITNILQVKQIFDTPELPLEITRSFIQNRDGSYEPFQCPRVEVESIAQAYGHPERQPPIRPLELRTFLKVGNTSPTQKEPTPFIIEWIPNILPQARVGELRIRFQYGHQPATSPGHQGHQPPTSMEPSLELTPLTTISFP
ncbi:uncharacterized protein C2orf42 homolog [Phaethornis superciliosus]